VNGTTGYEEAAAQGLMAGINAYRRILQLDPVILKREEAYIGVLIDDLITKGVDEPYRMFTSRAEYRILLRQDNADERLTGMGIALGLVTESRKAIFKQKMNAKNELIKLLRSYSVEPALINEVLIEKGTSPIKQKVKAIDILLRPEIALKDLLHVLPTEFISNIKSTFYAQELLNAVEIESKYGGYIEREKLLADKIGRLEDIRIDKGMEFDSLQSISTEGRFKLKKYKPTTIGQATRISGISPNDINVLLLYLGR
jgi:tRNA uridine 5-carboxymethylaminomethyl modification enzyme